MDNEREQLAFNMGAMFVRALQGDYDLVDYYAKEYQIDFKDGKPYIEKFSKSPQKEQLPLCDTTNTPRLSKNCCKDCGTYKDNLGPCKTFNQGANERCAYCDHELKCHPIAWHLTERESQKINLPHKLDILKRSPEGNYRDGWNACLQKVKEMNSTESLAIHYALRNLERKIK